MCTDEYELDTQSAEPISIIHNHSFVFLLWLFFELPDYFWIRKCGIIVLFRLLFAIC